MAGRDTRSSILDAAERLFAEHGYEGTSLRTITSRAGVNLASVNYHFRSKEALLQAVLARRLERLNEKRLALLGVYERSGEGKAPPLERLVEALFRPAFQVGQESREEGLLLRKLMGRMLSDPGAHIKRVLEKEFHEVAARFTAAFRRSLPALPPEELYWRMHFSMGAMAATLLGAPFLDIVSRGKCDLTDVDSVLQRITSYVCGGLRAPVPRVKRKTRRRPAVRRSKVSRERKRR